MKAKWVTISMLLIVFNLAVYNPAKAALKLPAIISSNMVIQRNSSIVLWGWTEANENVSIEVSWIDSTFNVISSEDGSWKTTISTGNSTQAQTIRFQNKSSSILLENILFGEVWVCSGQSNMEQPVKGFPSQPTIGSIEAIARSKNPNLRLFTVKPHGAASPNKDLEKFTSWEEARPASVKDFSAVAYFFGEQLQEILKVPVGLIHTSYGASRVEAWMSMEALGIDPQLVLEDKLLEDRPNHVPSALYNAMLHPLVPFTIKGAIWYQGESNRMKPEEYKELFPAMVKDWRTRWDIGDFPFYYVQIAPFVYWAKNDEFQQVSNSAFIRESQLQCLDLIPNSGIAITMDLGDEFYIHPPKKKEVADRLLYNALSQTYGFDGLDSKAPAYDSHTITEDGIVLKFVNAETGLYAKGELREFEIAGDDKVFYPAKAKIVNNTEVLVNSESVPDPKEVRYAWKNWLVPSLFDTYLLPASSFRTDNWEDATRAEIKE